MFTRFLLTLHTPVASEHASMYAYPSIHIPYVISTVTYVKVRTITVNMNHLTSSYVLEDYFDEEYVPHHRFATFCASSDVKYRFIENKRSYSLFLVPKPTYVNFMV